VTGIRFNIGWILAVDQAAAKTARSHRLRAAVFIAAPNITGPAYFGEEFEKADIITFF